MPESAKWKDGFDTAQDADDALRKFEDAMGKPDNALLDAHHAIQQKI